MLQTTKRLAPLAAMAALAAGLVLAAPAVAQRGEPPRPPHPQPQPQPGHDRAPCFPVGLALAVISESGVVADAMPAPKDGRDEPHPPRLDRPRDRIVLPRPGPVGACAQFQGFWGDDAGGTEKAMLLLRGVPSDAVGNAAGLAARDGVEQRRRGPSVMGEPLRAMVDLKEPGTYHFEAVLKVEASRATDAAVAPAAVTDELTVKFAVEVKEGRPRREPREHGTIEGTVTGPDGPLAGAMVTIQRPDAPRPAPGPRGGAVIGQPSLEPIRGGLVLQPVLPPGTIQRPPAGGSGGDRRTMPRWSAVTDDEGHYSMKVPAGKFLVVAGARGFGHQWYDHAPGRDGAQPVEVAAGETTSGIDFELAPAPKATLSGHVADADDKGIAGAVVMAVHGPTSPLASAAGMGRIATRTNDDGDYTLEVPPGEWAVGATVLTDDPSGHHVVWYDGADKLEDAVIFDLADGDSEEDIDFELP